MPSPKGLGLPGEVALRGQAGTRSAVTLAPDGGAGTSFIDANGVQTVVGTPIHLIGPNGGTA